MQYLRFKRLHNGDRPQRVPVAAQAQMQRPRRDHRLLGWEPCQASCNYILCFTGVEFKLWVLLVWVLGILVYLFE